MEFSCFFCFGGPKLGPIIDQKSIKKWSRKWKASWHRVLVDFGGFWEPSWERKSTPSRAKIDPKKHQKNDGKKLRLGCSWGGPFHGRAMDVRGFWDPLITNFQRKHHTTDHRPQSTTPDQTTKHRPRPLSRHLLLN